MKLFNWITCLALTLIFLVGATLSAFAAALVFPAYPVLGVVLFCCVLGEFAAAFVSMRLMERFC